MAHVACKDLQWAAKVVEHKRDRIAFDRSVLNCRDFTVVYGPTEEMFLIFRLVSLYRQASHQGNLQQQVDQTVRGVADVIGYGDLLTSAVTPFVRGAYLAKTALLGILEITDDRDIEAAMDVNMRYILPALELAEKRNCTFREALELAS